MNFDATKKIKHCYTRTIAQKNQLSHKNQPYKKKNLLQSNVLYIAKRKYYKAKFGTNLYESKLIKDQLMDK